MELQPIEHVWVNHDDDPVDLTLTVPAHQEHGKQVEQTSEVVHTNKKHPFLTTEKGFVPVGELSVGMHVVRADGSVGIITRWTVVSGSQTMYNLEVEQDHTFTVGDGQWVVHNCTSGFDSTGGMDLRGASYEQITARLPEEVRDQFRELNPIEGRATQGRWWSWKTDIESWTVRIHSADGEAPGGSNSATGWILRVIKKVKGANTGDWVMNAQGQWMRWALIKNDDQWINDIHIPIMDQTKDPTSPFYQG
jgi:Bacterial toxin 30/Pretoxin HINT domain